MKSILFGTILFISCSTGFSKDPIKPVKLTILHTNDHHGRFWENRDGEYGLAARATLINKLREEIKRNGGESILLDAGDVNTGVPQSDLLDAEPDFRGMAAIGYDVMAVGNHEFDKPLKTILKQQKEWAGFPFVSANIYRTSGKRVFPSHVTLKVKGLNIVVFGLTTEDTPKKSNPENSKGLTFRPSVEEAKSIVPKLRPKADVLIGLTHTGHYVDGKHGADAPGDVSIARAVKGIDVIVGGHTQKPLFQPDIVNGTIIVQAHEWGKYVGKVDLEIQNGKVSLVNYELIPVNLKDSPEKIPADPEIEAMLRPFKEKGDQELLIKIGTADEEFIGRRDVVRSQETNLGNLVSTAFKNKFGADIGIVNSGGLRDSIYPGDVTIETVLMVLPFAGEVVTAELTGAELWNYIEYITTELTPGSGSFPQISGLKAVINKKDKKLISLEINGVELDSNKKYKVALPEFIANGGDKYPPVKFTKYGYVDADVLKEFILKVKALKASEFAPKAYIRFE